jgi:hypothetical protein
MSWDVLGNDGLRGLPAVLVASRRWDDLRDTVFDPGYLRAVVSGPGLAALAQSLGPVVDGREVPTPLRARCADLRGLIVEEAGFLSASQYAGLAGPFRNHLDVAWVRRGRPAEKSPLSGDVADLGADVGQEGWLDLVARTGQVTRRATLFFMPGRRENFVSDIRYNSGPAGVETFLGVDLQRMHLLGETVSYCSTSPMVTRGAGRRGSARPAWHTAGRDTRCLSPSCWQTASQSSGPASPAPTAPSWSSPGWTARACSAVSSRITTAVPSSLTSRRRQPLFPE